MKKRRRKEEENKREGKLLSENRYVKRLRG